MNHRGDPVSDPIMNGISGIIELQSATGTKAKQEVLKKNANSKPFRSLVYYALNPMLTYNVSEKTLRDASFSINDSTIQFTDIFSCCDYLAGLRAVNSETVLGVRKLLSKYDEQTRELLIGLLSKTLRLGVTAKTVNKIIPNLIPEWEVQQSYPIDKYPLKAGTEFWLTQKLNGVRATYYKGKLYARSGTPYKGLDHITSELSQWNDIVFDGELTLKDKGTLSDNEAFRVSTGIINSDTDDKSVIAFTVFDCVPVADFESETPRVTYSARREVIDKFASLSKQGGSVRFLPILYHGNDQSQIPELLDQMVREDKEGLIVNTDVPYKRTRHRGILKVKRFYTMDLHILRCEEGDGRLKGTLGAFVLDYKGNEVRVGTGFTDEQRSMYWERREGLNGSLCEVKYKEVSGDKKTGLESLQFPVFVRLRDDKAEASYG